MTGKRVAVRLAAVLAALVLIGCKAHPDLRQQMDPSTYNKCAQLIEALDSAQQFEGLRISIGGRTSERWVEMVELASYGENAVQIIEARWGDLSIVGKLYCVMAVELVDPDRADPKWLELLRMTQKVRVRWYCLLGEWPVNVTALNNLRMLNQPERYAPLPELLRRQHSLNPEAVQAPPRAR